ncbi:MAG: hypothetical protein AB7R90_22055 [Reyranellaceae bacterium]
MQNAPDAGPSLAEAAGEQRFQRRAAEGGMKNKRQLIFAAALGDRSLRVIRMSLACDISGFNQATLRGLFMRHRNRWTISGTTSGWRALSFADVCVLTTARGLIIHLGMTSPAALDVADEVRSHFEWAEVRAAAWVDLPNRFGFTRVPVGAVRDDVASALRDWAENREAT